MPQAGERTTGSAASTARHAAQLRPRLGALDIAVQLWRARWLMLAVFAPLCAIGLAIAYTGDARRDVGLRSRGRVGAGRTGVAA
jgi:putative exporter of polyketide antibiotics